jgi:acyl-CoA reductase-like NAD-dependent aldehyde dehydrogenase
MGPLASKAQFEKVQSLIEKGIAEGAVLVAGGPGKPDGLDHGWFVKPTVFADVKPGMTIARQEIFGPVLSIMTYESEQDAIEIANNTDYGLAGYVHSKNPDSARRVAEQIRAGRIFVNNPPSDLHSPFGGYKQSGNGREQGVFGLEEYLEVKAVLGR